MAKESLRELLEFYRDHVHLIQKEWYSACSRWADKLGHSAMSEVRIRAAEDVARMHPKYVRISELLESLTPSLSELRDGAPRDIARILDFCEIDIMAFRLGYAKASIYQVLKRLDLSELQKRRIRELGLSYVHWPGQRREMRELGRLLIVVADEKLVLDLKNISDSSTDPGQRRKADILLYKILNSRMDLRSVVPLPKSARRY